MIKTLKRLEKENQAIQKSLNKLYHEQSIKNDEIRKVKSEIIKSKKLLSGIWKFDRYDDSTFSILSYDKFDDVDELVNGRCSRGGHWGMTIVGPEYSSNNEEQACLRYDDGDYRINFENYTPESINNFCEEWGITINFDNIYEQIKKLENDLNNLKQIIKLNNPIVEKCEFKGCKIPIRTPKNKKECDKISSLSCRHCTYWSTECPDFR